MNEEPSDTAKELLTCGFCKKDQRAVAKLIAGPGTFICNECVDVCIDIMEEDKAVELSSSPPKSPKELKLLLDEYVIGQDYAKKVLAVAVSNHTWRGIISKRRDDGPEIGKSNILLLGSTGVGKTHIARTLARIVNVPFAIVDATAYTEAGYVGEDVENILYALLHSCSGNVEKAQRGIVYIDELDKIAKAGATSRSIVRDVSGVGVQQALLKMLEGASVNLPPRGGKKHPDHDFVSLDTRDILFLAGGAFPGLEEIITRRLKRHEQLGQSKAQRMESNPFLNVTHADLIEYGFIPEFVARFPSLVPLQSLGREEMIRVLREPRNSLVEQSIAMVKAHGVDLEFTEGALMSIAGDAISLDLGARGLRAVMDRALLNLFFEMPLQEGIERCKITARTVQRNELPEFWSTGGFPVGLERNRVFISYASADEKWMDALTTHLEPIARHHPIEAWYDAKIRAGDNWKEEIRRALATTKVAVLLVSANFLKSPFIIEEELPYFFKAARSSELRILWVLLSPCAFVEDGLQDFQAAHDIKKPLSSLTQNEVDASLVAICQQIKEAMLLI